MVRGLLEKMGMSPYLRDYDIKEERKSLARRAHHVGQRLLSMNIREVTEEDAFLIFQTAFESA